MGGPRKSQPPQRPHKETDARTVRLRPAPRFEKAYRKLPDDVRERVAAALRQFLDNPRHPGLHFEKLTGSAYRTIRPDRKKYRIVLRDLGDDLYELVDVDRHAMVDRKYG